MMCSVVRGLFLIIFFSTIAIVGSCQSSFKFYTQREGLPQSDVIAIEEDSLGYLWIGMQAGGIAKFDGTRFERFGVADGLTSIEVSDLKIDRKGLVWIATNKSIATFDGKKFTNVIRFSENGIKKIFLLRDTVLYKSAFEPRWHYWHKGDTGTLAQNHPFEGVLIGRKITSKIFGGFNLRTRSIVIHVNDRWKSFESQDQFQRIFDITVAEPSGELIVSTPHGIFAEKSGKLAKVISSDITLHKVDSVSGLLWVSRFNDFRCARINNLGDTLYSFESITINTTLNDSEGNFWVALRGKGLIKIFTPSFIKIKIPKSSQNEGIRSIHLSKLNRLWIGTLANGIFVLEGERLVHRFYRPWLQYISAIKEDENGTIWVTANGGVFKFNGKDLVREYNNIVRVFAFELGKNGKYVASSGGGDSFYKNDSVTKLQNFSDRIRHIVYDKTKDTFIAGTEKGIYFLKDGKAQNGGISNQSVNVFTIARDSTYIIGTAGYGIQIINAKTGLNKQLTIRNGLCDDYIYSLAHHDKFLWIGTNNGVDLIEFSNDWAVRKISHFGADAGLEEPESNLNSIYLDSSQLLIGTLSGIYRHDLQEVRQFKKNPIHFTKLEFLRPDDRSKSVVAFGATAIIPPGLNQFTTSFNHVNKSISRENGKYRISLISENDTLQLNLNPNQDYTFSNLAPGNYVLEASLDGSTLQKPARFEFFITPYFFQTFWFRLTLSFAIVLLVITIVYLVVRSRYKKILLVNSIRQEEEVKIRKEIARDFHDELGNELAKLSNNLVLLKLKNLLNSDIHEQLNYSVQRIVVGTKDFIWTLDPDNNDLVNIVIHLKDFGERLFNSKKITFSFQGNVQDTITLPSGYSRQITLIFKEAMTNAYRHSNATHIEFGIKKSENIFSIYLKDNGLGFDYNNQIISGGVANMQSRAKRLDSQLEIHSQDQSGTTITLYIKL